VKCRSRKSWRDGLAAAGEKALTGQPNSQLTLEYFSVVGDAGWLAGFGWDSRFDPRAVVLVPK